MADSRTKKPTTTKSTPPSKPVAAKSEIITTAEQQPERQSQFATILIGLLIIASGLLIYNYFQSQSASTIKTVDQKDTKTSATPTPTPVFAAGTKEEASESGSYTVQSGDSLWTVAEKVYGDGHQWNKIADANQLQKDSRGRPVVEVGQKLKMPDSAASTSKPDDSLAAHVTPTPTPVNSDTTLQQTPDTAIETYTVKHGDSLWSIAEQVYGSGEQWVLIFNDSHNSIATLPNGRPLVHAGNQLYLPQAP